MLKYVTKELYLWVGMYRSGFRRRWSCSRNWPRFEKLQFRGTRDELWVQRYFLYEGGAKAGYARTLEKKKVRPGSAFERLGEDRRMEAC